LTQEKGITLDQRENERPQSRSSDLRFPQAQRPEGRAPLQRTRHDGRPRAGHEARLRSRLLRHSQGDRQPRRRGARQGWSWNRFLRRLQRRRNRAELRHRGGRGRGPEQHRRKLDGSSGSREPHAPAPGYGRREVRRARLLVQGR